MKWSSHAPTLFGGRGYICGGMSQMNLSRQTLSQKKVLFVTFGILYSSTYNFLSKRNSRWKPLYIFSKDLEIKKLSNNIDLKIFQKSHLWVCTICPYGLWLRIALRLQLGFICWLQIGV